VLQPDAFARTIQSLAPQSGSRKTRRAALILPDYCARVVVMDFDTFPTDPQEQLALARFRVKRAVPFDIDSALVACFPQQRPNEKRFDVAVAVVNLEVAAHYEAPFRAAGFHCGVVTLSALSALSLQSADYEAASPSVVAKVAGRVLALSLLDGARLRMFRCVALPSADEQEFFDVLAPTFAFAEDELKASPQVLKLCGMSNLAQHTRQHWSEELGLPLCDVRSRHGAVSARNAGLLGYLESVERN
jgi:type IV pilus assembly protein PilM